MSVDAMKTQLRDAITTPTASAHPGPRFGRRRDHLPWAIAISLCMLALLTLQLTMSTSAFQDGGQWWLGVASAVLLAVTMLFVARKRAYGSRFGHLRRYYLAHVWLGGLWGPVVLVHAGWSAHGPLFTTLLTCSILTWLTGLAGLGLHAVLKRQLQSGHTDAGLVEDLVASRGRLLDELAQLRAALPTELTALALRLAPATTVATRLRNLVTPTSIDHHRARRQQELLAQESSLGHEDRDELSRMLDDAVELERLENQLLLHRTRAAWLIAHTLLAVPVVILTVIHVWAVWRY